jgi:putative iron-only hydrogenase system regulator
VLPNFTDIRDFSVVFSAAPSSGTAEFFIETEAGIMAASTRVAVMGIIVENRDSTEPLNSLLHEYGDYIIGRMGIPYRERGISIISIAMDAPQNTIAALAGKIGGLKGVSVKTAYSSVVTNQSI